MDNISASLNTLLADAFALFVKIKTFHWHVCGRHFRDYDYHESFAVAAFCGGGFPIGHSRRVPVGFGID